MIKKFVYDTFTIIRSIFGYCKIAKTPVIYSVNNTFIIIRSVFWIQSKCENSCHLFFFVSVLAAVDENSILLPLSLLLFDLLFCVASYPMSSVLEGLWRPDHEGLEWGGVAMDTMVIFCCGRWNDLLWLTNFGHDLVFKLYHSKKLNGWL